MALSAANIRVPKPASPYEAMLEAIGAMLASLNPDVDKHDRATVLIHACIYEGVTGGADIVAIGRLLGFNTQHIGVTLAKGAGNDPVRHHLCRSEDGRYSVLDANPD